MYHHNAIESLHRLRGWTPTLAELSYQLGFICFSICLQCKISGSSVFSIFFPHKVSHHKVRKVWFQFLKKTSDRPGLGGLKSPKVIFLGFWQKSYPFRYVFLIQHESAKVIFTFCKVWFLIYGPKTWKQIRMQDSLNCNISQKIWGMKLNFWIWLEVQKRLL